jgi:hypothetical protein
VVIVRGQKWMAMMGSKMSSRANPFAKIETGMGHEDWMQKGSKRKPPKTCKHQKHKNTILKPDHTIPCTNRMLPAIVWPPLHLAEIH